MRLAQATGALAGENDYFRFANTLVTKGFAGEAKTVLEQGFAANSIDKIQGDLQPALFASDHQVAGRPRVARRQRQDRIGRPDPLARRWSPLKPIMATANIRSRPNCSAPRSDKQGVDKDVANLRLGMALARAGDKAGATAALNAVGGTQAEIAKLWLTYVATKA